MDPNGPVPLSPGDLNNQKLDYWMSFFVQETRRKNGDPYPPNSLTQLTAGIQRYIEDDCGQVDINFFQFRKALDARMKVMTKQGVGVQKEHADPVLGEKEEMFWDKGIFSLDTAQGLNNAVFFHNGKCFGYRSESEHKACKAEM